MLGLGDKFILKQAMQIKKIVEQNSKSDNLEQRIILYVQENQTDIMKQYGILVQMKKNCCLMI